MAAEVDSQTASELQIVVNDEKEEQQETKVEKAKAQSCDIDVTSTERTSDHSQSAVERLQRLASSSAEQSQCKPEEKKDNASKPTEAALPSINSITGESEAELLAKLEQANR